MAKIIDGSKIANEFNLVIRDRVRDLKKNGVIPKLVTITIGENERSALFSAKRDELAKFTGIEVANYNLDIDINLSKLEDLILPLNTDKSVHAIFLRTAKPKGLSFRDAVNLISPDKDVAGITTVNQGRLFLGEPGMIPCAPLAVLHLLRIIHGNLAGMRAVVLGRSSSVGRPLTQLLLNANCTVTSLHSYSKDLESICRTADILVSAMGNPGFITRHFVKEGATIIDVGLNHLSDPKEGLCTVGDVDFDDVFEVAGTITPVPNGVAPMTASYLMHNTLKLACCA